MYIKYIRGKYSIEILTFPRYILSLNRRRRATFFLHFIIRFSFYCIVKTINYVSAKNIWFTIFPNCTISS